ncbi:FAD binding domain-containing protein [Streptomyces hoynatensis]|uniref:Xanthine dehydrogenase family protein subunit M n=1 Tax=Streptomyces hoynatensis TaxID=1141874 RepID=A0A3A9Z1A8_9ACTN|nr:xanthine dehydrogenase family protein subunit M [Streptomyces hoynatensis]RKN41724.1 xanthine dehydrogenase family protein subunit M [Streptomyces hoynatensis]
MRPVSYARATAPAEAVAAVAADPGGAYLAGGTTAVDLLRQNVLRHDRLVDIGDLPLAGIEETPAGGLRIGALTRMSDAAAHPLVRERFPLIAEALELGASPQLRAMATMGGNLLQRVRCAYYRDAVSPCNKREPGTGCSALGGINRGHAILGTSEHCIATHPSDLAVALTALDARVHTLRGAGERSFHIDDFLLPPGDTPHIENPLEHGELITAIEVPDTPTARTSRYLKIRDRASYEFALTAVAATLRLENGRISGVRLALGGVATTPWRARHAERLLLGAAAEPGVFDEAARAELAEARTTPMNAFKAELARRAVVRVLRTLAATPEGQA